MLFVVYGHINFFSFKITPFVGKITEAIQMPLFFFISGFVAYKATRDNEIKLVLGKIWNKFRVLIIPATIMGLLYSTLILNKTIPEFVFEKMKYGYWFPFSLFSMILIYKLCELFTRGKSENFFKGFVALVAILLWLLKYAIISSHIFQVLNETLSLWQTLTHFPFFVFGVLLSSKRAVYERELCNNGLVNTFLLVAFCFCLFVLDVELPNVNLPIGGVLKIFIGISGTLLVLNFIIKYISYIENSKIGKFLDLVGRKSLIVYLLHYFLLPDLTSFSNVINVSSPVINISLGIVFSIIIVVISIVIGNIIGLSPFFSKYMLGVKSKIL